MQIGIKLKKSVLPVAAQDSVHPESLFHSMLIRLMSLQCPAHILKTIIAEKGTSCFYDVS